MFYRSFFYVVIIFFISFGLRGQNVLLSKQIKYRTSNRDLSNVLVDISKKAGVNIVFNIVDIPERNVTFFSPDYSLRDILNYLLSNTGLVFEEVNGQIVIYKKSKNIHDKNFEINGYIYDVTNGEKLIYANVYLPNFSKGTASNDYGFYNFNLNEGEKKLRVSHIGYYTKTVNIDADSTLEYNIALIPKPEKILDEILIIDNRIRNRRVEFFEPKKIDVNRIEKMVHLLGEDDIMRFSYLKPGVLTGADGIGGIHVRGGGSGDNAILLDGIPVYNAQHAIGMFSIFNSSTIKNINFLAGDFPARYGGSLNSVMDIRTRDGNNKKFGGELDMGLLTVKGLFEGPIIEGKSSFLMSFRRTFVDVWDDAISNILSNNLNHKKFSYYFYDLNFKFTHEINNRNKLFITFYNGKDDFSKDGTEYLNTEDTISSQANNNWKWGSSLFSIQWNSLLGNKTFMNTSLFYSNYGMKSNSIESILVRKEPRQYYSDSRVLDSKIKDLGLKFDFTYTLDNNNFKWGACFTRHKIEPMAYINSEIQNKYPNERFISSIRLANDNFNSKNTEIRYYLEDRIEFGRSSILNLGVHFAHYFAGKNHYFSFEPRVILNQNLNKNSTLTLSFTKMSQFLHTLTNNGLGLPSEILLPSTNYLLPEKIWHFNAGITYDFSNTISGSFKLYYKTAKNIIEHKEGSYFLVSEVSDWENYIPSGRARMYGFESQLNFNSKFLYIWFNYSFSRSLRSFEHILNGEYYQYRFSREHYINLVSVYKISKKMNLFFTGVYGSGNPFTLPTQLTPDGDIIYEEKNNWKLPTYTRIDVGIETKFDFEKSKHSVRIGVYNLLNRKNPFYIRLKVVGDNLLSSEFKEVYVFPLLPSISYSIKF